MANVIRPIWIVQTKLTHAEDDWQNISAFTDYNDALLETQKQAERYIEKLKFKPGDFDVRVEKLILVEKG